MKQQPKRDWWRTIYNVIVHIPDIPHILAKWGCLLLILLLGIGLLQLLFQHYFGR